MRRTGGALILLSLLTSSALVARPEEPAATVAEAPIPQMAVLSGRVLLKDGITPVAGAGLVLTESGGQRQFQDKTARSGRYKLNLPVGTYTLRIARGADVYTSPTVYRVSAGVRNSIDFLVVRDFEKPQAADDARHSAKSGPDPARSGPTEVGTIVDVVHEHTGSRWRRWAETLGFIGSLLLVSLAAG